MYNATTHYQTSFRVSSRDVDTFMRVKAVVYGWVSEKESDDVLRNKKGDFFFRCEWPNLYHSHSSIETNTFLSETGDAWALRYTELDKSYGRQRFWYSDIGVKKDESEAIVSVRISYGWNTEDLSGNREEPEPTVPKVIRYLLHDNEVYCGRTEFRLIEKPLLFDKVGTGKTLAEFIASPERHYPLIVFNGNSNDQMDEAIRLAQEVTGKSQVVILATNHELGEEFRYYLEKDYWVSFGFFRVFFPFKQRRNSPERHRWYNVRSFEYATQRQGVVHGLLRNHILQEKSAVESVLDINRLIAREKLIKLNVANPEQQKELEEFFKLNSAVEKERDIFKTEAATYASDVDRLEEQVKQLEWRCKDYQTRLDQDVVSSVGVTISEVFRTLPSNLVEVVNAAARAFPRLVITENALKTAADYPECKCITAAWEILLHLNEVMYRLKFDEGEKDLEGRFKEETGYHLAMSEGKQTQDDKKLMRLRRIVHAGLDYDITPHVKHGNQEPKLVRIYFAFAEEAKKIIVGHIGRHIPNHTSKTM